MNPRYAFAFALFALAVSLFALCSSITSYREMTRQLEATQLGTTGHAPSAFCQEGETCREIEPPVWHDSVQSNPRDLTEPSSRDSAIDISGWQGGTIECPERCTCSFSGPWLYWSCPPSVPMPLEPPR